MPNPIQFVSKGCDGAGQSPYEVSTTQHYPLGERLCLSDGRVFHYACNGETLIPAGRLVQSKPWIADLSALAAVASAAGDKRIAITMGATTAMAKYGAEVANTAVDVRGGYWGDTATTTAGGRMRKIRTHSNTAVNVAGSINLYEELEVANSVTSVLLCDPWRRTVIQPTTYTGITLGVTPMSIPASTLNGTQYYYWLQTWGPAMCYTQTAAIAIILQPIIPSASVAGAVDVMAAVTTRCIGYAVTTPTNVLHFIAMLTIWP